MLKEKDRNGSAKERECGINRESMVVSHFPLTVISPAACRGSCLYLHSRWASVMATAQPNFHGLPCSPSIVLRTPRVPNACGYLVVCI